MAGKPKGVVAKSTQRQRPHEKRQHSSKQTTTGRTKSAKEHFGERKVVQHKKGDFIKKPQKVTKSTKPTRNKRK